MSILETEAKAEYAPQKARKTLRLLGLLMLYLSPILFSVSNAFACTNSTSVTKKFQESDIVFSGTALDASCNENNKVVFKTIHVWKGRPAQKYALYFPACESHNFIKSTSNYLIYARRDSENRYYAISRYDYCADSIMEYSPKTQKKLEAQYPFITKKINKTSMACVEQGACTNWPDHDVYYNFYMLNTTKNFVR